MQSLPFCLYSQTGLFQIPKFLNVAKCQLISKILSAKKWNFFVPIFLLPQCRVGMQIDFFLGIRRRIRVQPHTLKTKNGKIIIDKYQKASDQILMSNCGLAPT